LRWSRVAAPLQFRHSLGQLGEPRFGRLQGSPGRRELRFLAETLTVEMLAKPAR
jgi:hypothetical protein